jgi:Asp-tRNA(Asn)/Glu-tRNA(Gln) amidotransferase B subunit
LIPLLQNTQHWENRWNIEAYVSRCMEKGFCKTADQMRLCAERYIAGKRKINPPGTQRRKVQEKKKAEALKNAPVELINAILQAMAENEKAVTQFKNGNEKVLNALVGGVMKRYKADPVIVKELLLQKINEN